jgi:HEAT repeat protein
MLVASPARAQRRGRGGRGGAGSAQAPVDARRPVPASLRPAVEGLASSDLAQVRGGIEALGVSGEPAAVAPLAHRIRQGLPAELLDAALDALIALARPSAGPVLVELLRHRRAVVRRKVVAAIMACRPPDGGEALGQALDDSDPQVRSAAALGIGQLRTGAPIDQLFLAFERGVLEAATAIGQIANAEGVTPRSPRCSRVATSRNGSSST